MAALHCINRSNNFLLGNTLPTAVRVPLHHHVLEQFQPQNGNGEGCHIIDARKPQSVLMPSSADRFFRKMAMGLVGPEVST